MLEGNKLEKLGILMLLDFNGGVLIGFGDISEVFLWLGTLIICLPSYVNPSKQMNSMSTAFKS